MSSLRIASALLTVTACTLEAAPEGDVGSLALSLASTTRGVEYRLTDAHFTLDGPIHQELSAGDEAQLELELPAGAYTLKLLDGYRLVRADDPTGATVPGRLVSANPMPVLVSAGETANVMLRFELQGPPAPSEPGRIAVELAVEPAKSADECARGLRISELDYDQVGADDAEFVELLNPGSCEASLAGIALELVNGGDGKVYARYELSGAASVLAGGARLVLGDEAVRSAVADGAFVALNAAGLQNGPDGLRLVRAEELLDALAYEGQVTGLGETFTSADDAERALSRCPEAADKDDASSDFKLTAPTPGKPNSCS